jgi:hypothetical protein
MGSIHIYITKNTFPEDWSASECNDVILKQRSAYLLDKMVEKWPKGHRDQFPTLTSLECRGGNDVKEKYFLLNGQVKQLQQEFNTLLDILLKKQFMNNVDSDTIIKYLSKDQYPNLTENEILKELLEIRDLIDYAANEECNIYIDR